MDHSTKSLVWMVVLSVGGILFFVALIIKELLSPGKDRDKKRREEGPDKSEKPTQDS